MINTTWYRRTDEGYYAWIGNFSKTVSQYEAELGVSAGDLEFIQDAATAYATAYEDLMTAKAIYDAAVLNKNEARAASENVNRTYIAKWQADPTIPNNIYEQLEIPRREGRGPRSAPAIPTNLIVTAQVSGEVVVRFRRNGNSQTTVFTIQESRNSGETWTNVVSNTRTRTTLTGYTPGQTVWFRVFATRNQISSPATVPAMIWPNGATGESDLALAA